MSVIDLRPAIYEIMAIMQQDPNYIVLSTYKLKFFHNMTSPSPTLESAQSFADEVWAENVYANWLQHILRWERKLFNRSNWQEEVAGYFSALIALFVAFDKIAAKLQSGHQWFDQSTGKHFLLMLDDATTTAKVSADHFLMFIACADKDVPTDADTIRLEIQLDQWSTEFPKKWTDFSLSISARAQSRLSTGYETPIGSPLNLTPDRLYQLIIKAFNSRKV